MALEGGGVALEGGEVALQGGGWHYKEGGGIRGRGGSTHCTALPVACSLKGLLVRRSPQNRRLHMASLSGGWGEQTVDGCASHSLTQCLPLAPGMMLVGW